MILEAWAERWATEEANNFNPAYCGTLIYEFARSYQKAKRRPAPFALIFCALPIALHPGTRDRLPATTASGMFPWLEQNRDLRVGFGLRARNLAPYVKEGLRYAIARKAVQLEEGGVIEIGPKRASFTARALDETTMDVRNTVQSVRMVARWFADAGDAASILAGWGIRL